MDESICYSPAGPGDEEEILGLLKKAGLPVEGVSVRLADFIVARVKDRLAGVAGVEHCGSFGLLRSMAVVENFRGRGIGRELVEKVQAHAAHGGIKALYLLTTTAGGYFARLGFEAIGRSEVPLPIRETAEFRLLCPASALCMVKKL